MCRIVSIVAICCLAFGVGQATAEAQYVQHTTYYAAPQPVYVQPVQVLRPVTYVQPTPVSYYRPLLRPRVVVAAPPVVQTVARPVVVARPTIPVVPVAPVVTTRYRPILGGTVSRAWYP